MAFNQYPKITLRHKDTYEYVSTNETGNSVEIDMYDANEKKHQSPTELLLSAVASCTAVDVVEILQKRRKEFTDFTIEAKGDRQADHPRYFKKITLTISMKSANVTASEVEKHAKLIIEKYCSVATTVSGMCELEVIANIEPEN